MINDRNLELISAQLDGQLDERESARLEALINADPELASARESLRRTRSLLRRTPQRRAPRNFTINAKMVKARAQPRGWYPVFNLASVLATLIFMMVFSADLFRSNPLTAVPFAMQASQPYGIGGGPAEDNARTQSGGGCDPCEAAPEALMIPPVTESVAAEAIPMEATPGFKTAAEEAPLMIESAPFAEPDRQPEFPWTMIEIGLLIIAVGAGGAAYWSKRNS